MRIDARASTTASMPDEMQEEEILFTNQCLAYRSCLKMKHEPHHV